MFFYKPYARDRALEYARRFALGRNPLFYNFTGIGGDCTNFVSQCVLAGTCIQNFTPDFGWYYRSPEDRAPAFTGVEYFWRFMTGDAEYLAENGGVGPFGWEISQQRVQPADVVQLGNGAGEYYHTLIVTGVEDGDLLLASHSNDVYDRRLSSYRYETVRFLHLEGARVNAALPDCFDGLISGTALPLSNGCLEVDQPQSTLGGEHRAVHLAGPCEREAPPV